jgi:hypothetical protein
MGGQGVLGHRQQTSQIARGKAIRLMRDQQAERFKSCNVRQRSERAKGRIRFHESRLMELRRPVKHAAISIVLEISFDIPL